MKDWMQKSLNKYLNVDYLYSNHEEETKVLEDWKDFVIKNCYKQSFDGVSDES